MKVLVYGAKGWIGGQMVALLKTHSDIEVVTGKARVDNYKSLCEELDTVKPDRVFSSIGRTHGVTKEGKVYTTIDYLELPGNWQLNVRDNLIGPQNLTMACSKRGIHFSYLGTGCIFKYDEKHQVPEYVENQTEPIDCSSVNGFTEDDEPNFVGSGYSSIKGVTDKYMHIYEDSVLNLRIRMPITLENNPRDFITKITKYENICSIPNSMSVLPQILPIMVHMIVAKQTGTFNMCNPGVMTHNQILNMYRQYVDEKFTYKNFTEQQQAKILLSGRSNNFLETSKIERYCADNQLPLDTLFDAVENLLRKKGLQMQQNL